MRNKFSLKLFAGIALAAGFSACSDSNDNYAGGVSEETEGALAVENKTIAGVSQKGPFVEGTTITLYGMDEKLHETGETFTTTLDNSKGEYSLKNVSLKNRYALLTAEGKFINEFTGNPYHDSILLNSLVDLKDRDHVNINVLTHLSFKRILNLVHNGKSVSEAKKQAEKEVLKAFRMDEEEASFDQLNILNDKEGDAKLLAISLIMLKAGDKDDVANRMDIIASDIETDGLLNDSANKEFMEHVSFDAIFGIYTEAIVNLVDMGRSEDSSYLKYIEHFALSDTTWMLCNDENEVQKRTSDNIHYVICRNGKWKGFYGPIEEGKWEIDTAGKYGSFTDERDGHIYKTLDIKMKDGSTSTWMANAVTYEAPKSKRDIEEDESLSKYPKEDSLAYIQQKYANVRLYNIHQILNLPDSADTSKMRKVLSAEGNIQGICPEGWHIPKNAEFEKLLEAVADDKQIQNLLIFPVYIEMESDNFMKDLLYTHSYSLNDVSFIGYYTNIGNRNYAIEESSKEPIKIRSIMKNPNIENFDTESDLELFANEEAPLWSALRCVKD